MLTCGLVAPGPAALPPSPIAVAGMPSGGARIGVETPVSVDASAALRCDLRLAREDDIAAIASLLRDDDVWRWCAGSPIPESALVDRFAQLVQRNARGAACLWTLVAESRRLGFVSLEGGEISFAVDAAFLGRGLGTELLRRFCEIGPRTLRLVRLKACVQRGNVRAIRCLERQGFRFTGRTRRASDPRARWLSLLGFEFELDEE